MKKFKRIYIGITNYCNLQCSFCPQSKRKKEYMSVENFEKVLEKIKGHGQYIYLHIKGEPLLHPDLELLLKLCKAYGLKVNLTTNATLLFKNMDVLFNSSVIRQISISLQSFENIAEYNAFTDYLNQVLFVVNKGRTSTNIIFELRLWNYIVESQQSFDKNQTALDMIKESLDLQGDIYGKTPEGKGVKLLPQVYLSKSYQFEWPDLGREIITTEGSCYGLRQQIGILVNGDVVPCCLDSEGDVILGNLFESNFEDIVHSRRAENIVKGFEKNRLTEPLCQRCGYREIQNKRKKAK